MTANVIVLLPDDGHQQDAFRREFGSLGRVVVPPWSWDTDKRWSAYRQTVNQEPALIGEVS